MTIADGKRCAIEGDSDLSVEFRFENSLGKQPEACAAIERSLLVGADVIM